MFEMLFLLLLLQLKHYYSDFCIQTYAQTVRKGIYRDPVGISHSIDHVWTSLLVLLIASFYIPLNVSLIIPLCLAEGFIHYHIDWIKVRFGSKDLTKPVFWNQFGQDQLAHQLTYIGMLYCLLAY